MHHLFSPLHTPPDIIINGTHDTGLVILSILVSIFSTCMALQTSQIARRTETAVHKQLAISTGALALGGGIWTMHFIGMLAYQLPTAIRYDTSLTLMSLVPACLTSWVALWLLTKHRVTTVQRNVSGILAGAGIGLMHYIGMAGMQTELTMHYDPFTFAVSVMLAVVLSTIALWIPHWLKKTTVTDGQAFFAGGTIMGLAISATHYTGMHAAFFIGSPTEPPQDWVINSIYASLALASFTFTVTVMVVALNALLHSKELNRKIERSQSRLQATLDTAVDGIITIDGRGLIRGFNTSAERLFGWSASEVMGKNIKMLMPEPDQSRHDSYLQNYHQSGKAKVIGIGREVVGLRKDGSLMPMRLAVGRMDLGDELMFVGFVTDVSGRHALEASLRETAEREQAAAAKSTFLANMSHEIRTPMNSVIGFTELLLAEDLTDIQRNYLNNIRQSSRTLLGLINDILDTTKLEKGQFEIESRDFSLRALAMQIESALWPNAQKKNLSLTTVYPASMPEYFKGDALRILQILTNLVGNAIKFTELGGVEVVFSYKDGTVTCAVHDSGIGMTEAQLETIFAPFTQADASISRRFGGTGLGTTIARQLAELMQGSISVSSQPGKGSTFEVCLPLPPGEAPVKRPKAPEPTHLQPLNILIADDVPQNLELLALSLTHRGHQVQQASNGQEVFDLYKAQRFDLILMDVHMPGTDGLQATRLIRQYERAHGRAHTPIIALTASVMEEDRKAAKQAGMDDFAEKPLDMPSLLETIVRVVDLHPAPSPPNAPSEPSEPSSDHLIDWSRGIALWGCEARLQAAIASFLTTVDSRYPLILDPGAEDHRELLFNLHSLKGAAGNLALPGIVQSAARIEELVHNSALAEAETELGVIKALLKQVRERYQPVPAMAVADADPVSKAPVDQPLLQQLLEVLERNELDDELLAQVLNQLNAAGHGDTAQSLEQALHTFDFDQARTHLIQLCAVPAPTIS